MRSLSLKSVGVAIGVAMYVAAAAHAAQADQQVANGLTWIVLGDLDGDQATDVVRQGVRREDEHSATLAAVQGAAVQRWTDGFLDTNWSQAFARVLAGDFNGDASADFITQGSNPLAMATVVHSQLTGELGIPVQTISDWYLGLQWDGGHHQMLVADFNGDGRDDLFLQGVQNRDRHALALADSEGTFTSLTYSFDDYHQNRDWSTATSRLVTGDFDGNGTAEIVVQPVSSQQSTLVLGSSPQRWLDVVQTELPAQHLDFDWTANRHRLVVGDFNGDGADDLFLLAATAVEQSALIPSSGGKFDRVDRIVDNIPNLEELHQVLVGDFDADGIDDLVLTFSDSSIAPALLVGNAARASEIARRLRSLGLLDTGQQLTQLTGRQVANGRVGGASSGTAGSRSLVTSNSAGGASVAPMSVVGPTEPPVESKVQPYSAVSAPIWQEFGSSGGEFQVDQSGAATYTIPIAVAPGSAGVAPKLSLTYSSYAANGVAGIGWNIGGLSVVSRRRASFETDGFDAPVRFDDTARFSLDGAALIEVTSQSTTGNWVYRTEIDSFAKVNAVGGSKGHPNYFKVTKKDGTLSYYGLDGTATGSINSKLPVNGGSHNGQALSWSLARVEDSVGNYIDFRYTINAGAQLIDTVRYGGRGQSYHSYVLFSYQDRPDVRKLYAYGGLNYSTKRLVNVSTYGTVAPTGQSGYTGQVREYRLTYNNTGATESSRVEYIQECRASTCLPAIKFDWQQTNGNVSFTADPPPIPAFDAWTISAQPADLNGDGSSDFISQKTNSSGDYSWIQGYRRNYGGTGPNEFKLVSEISLQQWVKGAWHAFDYNADGRIDILTVPLSNTNNTWKVALADADGAWSNSVSAMVDTGIALLGSGGESSQLVDVNGDALPDLVELVSASPDAAGKYYFSVALSGRPGVNGHSCKNTGAGVPYCFAAPIAVELAVNIIPPTDLPTRYCNPAGATPKLSVGRQSIDVDGNSSADFLLRFSYPGHDRCDGFTMTRLALTDFDGSSIAIAESGNYAAILNKMQVNVRYSRFSDLNGDGLTDLLLLGTRQDAKAMESYLNTGETFVQGVTPPTLTPGEEDDVNVIDMNNDGLSDLVYPNAGGSHYAIRYQTADGTFPEEFVTSLGFDDRDENSSDVFADFDGDGRIERTLLQYELNGHASANQRIQYQTDKAVPPPVINTITLPTGAITGIEYKPMTDPSVYTKGAFWATNASGRGSPVLDVLAPLYLVSRASSSAPTAADANAKVSVRYAYKGFKIQSGGRGPLGFESITSTDEQSGITTATTFRQDWPMTGMIDSVVNTSSSGIRLSETTNTFGYQVSALLSLYWFVDISRTKTQDLTGSTASGFLSHTMTDSDYDQYGNVSQITVDQLSGWDDGSSVLQRKRTVNSYGTTADEAFFGRLSHAVVTTTRGASSASRTSQFFYDSATGASGQPTRLLKETVVEPNGGDDIFLRTVYGLDNFGNRTKTTVCSRHVANCGIDTAQDSNNARHINRSSTVEYDGYGRFITKKFNHYGQLIEELVSYYDSFQPKEVRGPTGKVTTNGYSAFGRLESSYDSLIGSAAATRSVLEKCSSGCSFRITTSSLANLSPTAVQGFDVLGRETYKQVMALNGNQIAVFSEYDNRGRLKRKSAPHFYGLTPKYEVTTYDDLNRIRSVAHIDGSSVSTTYAGLTATTTNEVGIVKQEVRNALGELISATDNVNGVDAPPATISYTYDMFGNLETLTRPNLLALQSKLTYDSYGRKIRMWDADKSSAANQSTGGWLYQYNALGELTQQTDARDYVVRHFRDALGRTVRTDEYDAGGVLLTQSLANYHNLTTDISKTGALLSDSDSASGYVRTYSYDPARFGLPTGVRHQVDGLDYSESTGYDGYGRVEVQRDITGKGTRTLYSATGGYAREVQDADNASVVYRQIQNVDAFGNATQEAIGGSLVTTRYHNPDTGRLENISTTSNGSQIQSLAYNWYANGSLRYRYDNSGGKALREDFGYDGLDRLKTAIVNGGTASKNLSLTYDAEGNIATKSDVEAGALYSYGGTQAGCMVAAGPHAITSIASRNYCYDGNGNQVSGDGRTLTYGNTFDLPTVITSSSHITTFAYGPGHARFKRTDEKLGTVPTGETPKATTYYFGGVEVVVKTANSGAPLGTEFRRNVPNAVVSNGNISYVLTDHLGSTDLIVNCNGQIVEAHSFDAFGKQRQQDWTLRTGNWAAAWPTGMLAMSPMLSPRTAAKTSHGFTGHEMVDELGLVHMNGRMYDPHLGRFLQADPLIQAPKMTQSLNRYSYIINNPLSGVDPSGFSWWSEGGRDQIGTIVAIVAMVVCQGACQGVAGQLLAYFQGAVLARSLYYAYQYGQFTRAAVGAAMSFAAGRAVGAAYAGATGSTEYVIASVVVGGTLSVVSGGKFVNGAASSAFFLALNWAAASTKGSASDSIYAELSSCIYDAGCSGKGDFQRVGQEQLEKKGLGDAKFVDDDTGFKSGLFYNEKTNQYVLAFAGTDGLSWDDWGTNFGQSLGFDTAQYGQAKGLAERVDKSISQMRGDLAFTGHSLGGGLASAAAIVTGRNAVTFNSAGLNANTVKGYSMQNASSLIRAYYTRSDVLSIVQDYTPLANAAGQRIPLAAYGVHQISGVCTAMGTSC